MSFRDFINRIGTLGNMLLPLWLLLLIVDAVKHTRVSMDIVLAIIVFGVVFGDDVDFLPYRSKKYLIMKWTRTITLVIACLAWVPLAFYLVDTIGEDPSFKRTMIAPIVISFLSMLWIIYTHHADKDSLRNYKKLRIKRVIDDLNPFYGNEHDHKVFLIGSNGVVPESRERIARAAVHDGIKIWSIAEPGGHDHVDLYMEACKRNPNHFGYRHGFVTTHGRFVDRIEGFDIAQEANQMLFQRKGPSELYAEDVWNVSKL